MTTTEHHTTTSFQYKPPEKGKYNKTELRYPFNKQSPKLEEDTMEVIKFWFTEKKLSLPSESKFVLNMVPAMRSVCKKWLWSLNTIETNPSLEDDTVP